LKTRTRKPARKPAPGDTDDLGAQENAFQLLWSWGRLVRALRAVRDEAGRVRALATLWPQDRNAINGPTRADRSAIAFGELASQAALAELAASASLASLEGRAGRIIVSMADQDD
jgi:hypothetical protein